VCVYMWSRLWWAARDGGRRTNIQPKILPLAGATEFGDDLFANSLTASQITVAP
jgi:hypothetical protein